MKPRLASGDYRFIGVCLLLLAGTVWFSARNFYRAFPEASIDFRVNRDEARALAGRFLASRRYPVEGYRQAGQFEYDDDAKTFLERELGLEQANRIMGSRVRLWRWSNRWFRPLQKEEFTVNITPSGEFVAFEHLIPDDAARPAISSGAARAAGEEFLRTQLGRDAASMDFVESAETVRKNRTDRSFTWKERNFELHEATYRFEVTMLGDEVGAYREYLKVPEQWSRDYQKLRSRNEAASLADGVATLLLVIGMLVVIVQRVRRHDVMWRRAAIVGLIAMALAFLAQLNEFPLHEYSYPTTDSYASFVSRQLLQAILAALGSGGLLFVLTAGAEPLYRGAFPNQVSLGNLFSARGIRTKRFLLGSILGITLTGIFIAYQTGFYILAYRWGAWSPADVPYSDLLNTKFPWAFVLFGGFFPAVSEEFVFRMFAIPFLRQVARNWVVALILAGFIWGFGHAAYPQQPFFIRGVEVGIGGVALGIIMLRWGILPTLVWHYSVDAMYSAMLLVRSPNSYLKLSGIISAGIVVLPVVAALVLYWRKGGFESEEGLLNGDETSLEPHPEVHESAPMETRPAEIAHSALPGAARWTAAALLIAGLASLAIPIGRFGSRPDFRIDAAAARKSADEFLRTQVLDPDSYLKVTWPAAHWEGPDSIAAKYFLQRMPADRASQLFDRYRPLRHWVTRYYRALERDEIIVSVHPETGRVLAVVHTLPEDKPGADIAAELARATATGFAASLGQDVSAMDLKENASEKKKARRDYALAWEARPGDPRNVGETLWRVQVGVAGDRAVSVTGNWKPPETFVRERERQTAVSIIVLVLRIIVSAALVVLGLSILVEAVRRGAVRWREAMLLALPAAVLVPVGSLLTIHLMAGNYDTAMPLETFQAMTWIGLIIAVLSGIVMMVAAGAVIGIVAPDALAAMSRAGRRMLGRDALVALVAAVGIALLVAQAQALLAARFHAQSLPEIGVSEWIASRVPALSALGGAARSWLLNAAGLALAAVAASRLKTPGRLAIAAMIAAASVIPSDARTPAEFVVSYAGSLLAVFAAIAFCAAFGRRNWLAYAVVLWVAAMRGPLMQAFGNQNPALEVQGWILAAILGAGLLWALLPAFLGTGADR